MRCTLSLRRRPIAVLAFGAAGLLGLGLFCGSARADDAACKSLADAMLTNAKSPYHSVGTITVEAAQPAAGASIDPPKTVNTETIFTGKQIFVKLPSGKWQDVHASLDDLQDRVRKSADNFTDCQHLADETVDGKTLAIYTGENKNDVLTVSTKVWVASDNGALVRSETEMTGPSAPDGKIRQQHLALRYDYSDIKAPTDVQ